MKRISFERSFAANNEMLLMRHSTQSHTRTHAKIFIFEWLKKSSIITRYIGCAIALEITTIVRIDECHLAVRAHANHPSIYIYIKYIYAIDAVIPWLIQFIMRVRQILMFYLFNFVLFVSDSHIFFTLLSLPAATDTAIWLSLFVFVDSPQQQLLFMKISNC